MYSILCQSQKIQTIQSVLCEVKACRLLTLPFLYHFCYSINILTYAMQPSIANFNLLGVHNKDGLTMYGKTKVFVYVILHLVRRYKMITKPINFCKKIKNKLSEKVLFLRVDNPLVFFDEKSQKIKVTSHYIY